MENKIKEFIYKRAYLYKIIRFLVKGKVTFKSCKKKIRGKNNVLNIEVKSILINSKFDIIGNNNTITVQKGCNIKKLLFYIKGNNNSICISNEVIFNNGGSIWIEDNDCKLKIGEKSTFEDVHIALTETGSEVSIGNNCMFAYDIDIRTGDSHSIIDKITGKRINHAKSISIGDHTWIGAHVSILKGCNIPSNTVIATRSLVTKSFSHSYTIIGGIPAKIIKENIDWDRRRL